MAEELHQGGVCGSSGANWAWNNNPTRNHFFNPSPCSYSIGSLPTWSENPDRKTSSDESGAASDTSVVLQDSSAGSAPVQMMGLCSSADDAWNQGFIPDNTQSGGHNHLQIHKNLLEDPFITSLQQPSPDSLITAEPYTTFPANSPPYNYNSALLQTLFDSQDLQSDITSYPMCSPHFLPELSEPSNFPNPNYALPKPQIANHFQYTNSTPLCNSMAATLPNPAWSQPHPSPFAGASPNLRHTNTNKHDNKETTPDSAKKSSTNVGNKRARTENPSLPAFKVRKEKLGDRITALQQLVSPFGKTDTASVLQEAIEYIKFLHDQVYALTTPYLKNGTPPLQHQQAPNHRIKDRKIPFQDLRSRGLCLVPASSTFPVTTETASDFWTPTFGGAGFR